MVFFTFITLSFISNNFPIFLVRLRYPYAILALYIVFMMQDMPLFYRF